MTASTVENAIERGWPTLLNADVALEAAAARLLPASFAGVAIRVQDERLLVAFPRIPHTSEVAATEALSGLLVTPVVASDDTVETLRARIRSARNDFPTTVPAVLARVPDWADQVTLTVGIAPRFSSPHEVESDAEVSALNEDDLRQARDFVSAGSVHRIVFTEKGQRWRSNQVGNSLIFSRVAGVAADFDELGLPGEVRSLERCEAGLVIIASPARQGRTTTLFSLLDGINADRGARVHVITESREVALVQRTAAVDLTVLDESPEIDPAQLVTDLALSGAGVIAVDVTRPGHALTEACVAAASAGALVLVTVPAGSVGAALSVLTSTAPAGRLPALRDLLGSVFSGGHAQVSIQSQPRTSRRLASELWWPTPALRAAIKEGRSERFEQCVNTGYGGTQTSTTMTESRKRLLGAVAPTSDGDATGASDVPDEWDVPSVRKGASETGTVKREAAMPFEDEDLR